METHSQAHAPITLNDYAMGAETIRCPTAKITRALSLARRESAEAKQGTLATLAIRELRPSAGRDR